MDDVAGHVLPLHAEPQSRSQWGVSRAVLWGALPIVGVAGLSVVLLLPVLIVLSASSNDGMPAFLYFFLLECIRLAITLHSKAKKLLLRRDPGLDDVISIWTLAVMHSACTLFEYIAVLPLLCDIVYSRLGKVDTNNVDICAAVAWSIIIIMVFIRTLYEMWMVYWSGIPTVIDA